MGTKTRPWIFFDDHICTSGTKQGIILVGAIGLHTQKFPHFLFTYSENHWANLSTKIELAAVIWKWVVDQYFEDARKQGRAISRQEAEDTAQCVWLLDCW